MTAVLVGLTELKTYIPGTPSGDDTVLQDLLDHVENKFLRDCGRLSRPFATTQASITEWQDGTGTATLYLNYVPSAITSIKLGRDSSDPDETLDSSDVDVLVWTASASRKLVRTDGGVWRETDEAKCIQVVYAGVADLPEAPQLAIKRLVAALYRQRGAEDVSSESVGAFYSRQLAKPVEDSVWLQAVHEQRWAA